MKGRFCLASVLIIAGTAVASTGFASRAIAGTATSNLIVSASVTPNCSISGSTLNFGNYDPIVANATANNDVYGILGIACTSGASITITLGQGANAASGSTDAAPLRQMKSGSNVLSYNLYKDPSRTTVFGNTPATGATATGTGTTVTYTMIGRIPSGQNVPVGSYTDTVVATVTF